MNAPTTVANVLGEHRAPQRAYPDGSWTCPFCGAACIPEDRFFVAPCPNPMCEANPRADAEEILERRRVIEQRQREAEARTRLHEQRMEAMRRDHEARDARLAEVREDGYCALCYMRSGDRKRVRHRRPDFHG